MDEDFVPNANMTSLKNQMSLQSSGETNMEIMQENCPKEAQMQSLGNSGWSYQGEFLEEAGQ